MRPTPARLRSMGEMNKVGRKAKSATKGFGRKASDGYARKAESRLGSFVRQRKGL